MITKEAIIDILKNVLDPELNINIVDLGLLYDAQIEESTGDIELLLTLTSMGCPLYPAIEQDIHTKLQDAGVHTKVVINLTFEPAWSMDRMSEAGKAELGLM